MAALFPDLQLFRGTNCEQGKGKGKGLEKWERQNAVP